VDAVRISEVRTVGIERQVAQQLTVLADDAYMRTGKLAS
jgi:hypothetical protein